MLKWAKNWDRERNQETSLQLVFPVFGQHPVLKKSNLDFVPQSFDHYYSGKKLKQHSNSQVLLQIKGYISNM